MRTIDKTTLKMKKILESMRINLGGYVCKLNEYQQNLRVDAKLKYEETNFF